jgi:hypothetical protein
MISQWSIRTNGGTCSARRPDADDLLPSPLGPTKRCSVGLVENIQIGDLAIYNHLPFGIRWFDIRQDATRQLKG